MLKNINCKKNCSALAVWHDLWYIVIVTIKIQIIMEKFEMLDSERFDLLKVKEAIRECAKIQDEKDLTMGEISNMVQLNGLTIAEAWEVYEYIEHWGFSCDDYRGVLKNWNVFKEMSKCK